MTFKETVVRGTVNSHHLVQLFDNSESLADGVYAFVHEGVKQGDAILLVLTPPLWTALAKRAQGHGLDVTSLLDTAQLTVCDAAQTLATFMHQGQPDVERFQATVGNLVRGLRADGRRLRIYGEMVDLLARENDFRGAQELETYWNELGTRESFTLLCGYSSENFGAAQSAGALRDICRLHSHVRTDGRDVLGSFLVNSTRHAS